ncbi:MULTISPECIES: recombination-associated protein RdgC [Vreelandella]|uniref:Recombination-associated protein RdgC n=1 Tax=Vreelandella neptunia TaxID=115551 RepID=A0ABS9SBU4_9GAMM|nr:recombination-associated protein RdgC [Halomonas neptunia]MCH4813583.1 recombination-associated protein RdgC [Halomonas neptunia]
MQLQDDLALKKNKFDDALLEMADSGDDEASRFDADAHIHIPALAAVAEELITLQEGEVVPTLESALGNPVQVSKTA